MNKNLKERLERMTQEEREERFRELGEKLACEIRLCWARSRRLRPASMTSANTTS